jgi:hypothetical protein
MNILAHVAANWRNLIAHLINALPGVGLDLAQLRNFIRSGNILVLSSQNFNIPTRKNQIHNLEEQIHKIFERFAL